MRTADPIKQETLLDIHVPRTKLNNTLMFEHGLKIIAG